MNITRFLKKKYFLRAYMSISFMIFYEGPVKQVGWIITMHNSIDGLQAFALLCRATRLHRWFRALRLRLRWHVNMWALHLRSRWHISDWALEFLFGRSINSRFRTLDGRHWDNITRSQQKAGVNHFVKQTLSVSTGALLLNLQVGQPNGQCPQSIIRVHKCSPNICYVSFFLGLGGSIDVFSIVSGISL